MVDKSWVTITVAIVGAFATVATAWIGAGYRVGKVEKQTDELAHNSVGTLSGGQKLCSAIVPNIFRDSVIVPQSWQPEQCRLFAGQVGGLQYQLGCVFSDGVKLGGANGGFPSPNCGW